MDKVPKLAARPRLVDVGERLTGTFDRQPPTMATVHLDGVAADAPSAGVSSTAAQHEGGSYLGQLEEELRQLALQQAAVDDLSFAYQLQLQEVLQASAGRSDLHVSASMFAPESQECLQRRSAVQAQVTHDLSICMSRVDNTMVHC